MKLNLKKVSMLVMLVGIATAQVTTVTFGAEIESGVVDLKSATHTLSWAASDNFNDFVIQGQMNGSTRTRTNGATFNESDGTTTVVAASTTSRKLSAGSSFSVKTTSAGTITAYIISASTSGTGSFTVSPDTATITAGAEIPKNGGTGSPLIINANAAGEYTITNGTSKECDVISIHFDEGSGGGGSTDPVEKYEVAVSITNNTNIATDVTIGGQVVNAVANTTSNGVIEVASGTYGVGVSSAKVKAEPSSVTIDSSTKSISITINENTGKVTVTDSQGGYLGSYDTIKSAIDASTTISGSVISVMPGEYNECFEVNKSVTIQRAEGETGEVIVGYRGSGLGGASMNGTIFTSADNVTLKNMTIINTENVTYGGFVSSNSSVQKAAALVTKGNNTVIESCKIMATQDTLYILQASANTTSSDSNKTFTFNNCIIMGCTDFVCGGSTVTFNNCDFRFFTGAVTKEKNDGYIFAPSAYAKWVVNGGSVHNDEQSIIKNYYYARGWEDRASNNQTIDIYGISNELTMGTAGLMGFHGVTGGHTEHSTNDYQFNIYAGSDSSSELVATSNVTGVTLFEMNADTPVVTLKNKNGTNLLIADFGKLVGDAFEKNVIADIIEVGFVSAENASADKINDTNKIATTVLYKNITSGSGEYELNEIPNAVNGSYFGIGEISGITSDVSISVVPYVKYDADYSSSDGLDVKPIYKFGDAVTVNLKA